MDGQKDHNNFIITDNLNLKTEGCPKSSGELELEKVDGSNWWSSPQLITLQKIEDKISTEKIYDNEVFAQDLIVCKSLTSYYSSVIYNKLIQEKETEEKGVTAYNWDIKHYPSGWPHHRFKENDIFYPCEGHINEKINNELFQKFSGNTQNGTDCYTNNILAFLDTTSSKKDSKVLITLFKRSLSRIYKEIMFKITADAENKDDNFKKFVFQKNLVIYLCAIFNHNFFINKQEIESHKEKCFICKEFHKLYDLAYNGTDNIKPFETIDITNKYSILDIIFKCKEYDFPEIITEQLVFLHEQDKFRDQNHGPKLDHENHWWWLVIRKTCDIFLEDKHLEYKNMGLDYLSNLIDKLGTRTQSDPKYIKNPIYSVTYQKGFVKINPVIGGGKFSDIIIYCLWLTFQISLQLHLSRLPYKKLPQANDRNHLYRLHQTL